MRTALWWIRRDLRLSDNQALAAAPAAAEQVLPVFILAPVLLASREAGAKRVAFLFGGLRQQNCMSASCPVPPPRGR